MPGSQRDPARPQYDPGVLRDLAARVKAVAALTVAIWTIIGVVVGAGVFALIGLAFDNAFVGLLVGLVLGGIVGYVYGEHRALMLRLEAELALCHIVIEENTRASVPPSPKSSAGVVAEEIVVSNPAEVSEPVAEVSAKVDVGPEEPAPVSPAPEYAPIEVPPGRWVRIDASGVSGRFDVLSGDERVRWARSAAKSGSVTLEAREDDTWMRAADGSATLLSYEAYRWAAAAEQPGLLLAVDAKNVPKMLLRRTA